MTDPTSSRAVPPDDVLALRDRVDAAFPAVRADLERLVRVPSISNPEFEQGPLDESAALVADLLRGAGLVDVQVLTATTDEGVTSRPAVLGRRPAPPGRPTVLLYAHHDVQPSGAAADWQTDPFEPVERDGRLYGRGAADDKAGIVAHLGALRVLGDDLGVGVTVLVEGEEEIGSPTSAAFLATHRDLLSADLVILADSVNWKVGVPAFTTSLRGLVDCDVEVAVLEHAVHSGMFGGPVLDAPTLLARLIATLHDDDGNVAVAGLDVGPEPAVDHPEADFRAEASVLPGVRLAGSGTITGRLWTTPAISVTGIDAPSVARASNTITATARAKLSMRIVPGQDPVDAAAALRDHLLANAPFGARVTVTDGERGRAWRGDTDHPLAEVARSAFADAWGTTPVDVGLGGSIPLVADLVDAFPQATVLVTGVEDPDSRAHAADESVHLGELARVVLAEALLLSRLG